MESFLEALPWVLASLLGLSEALAHIPALKSNSILQLATGLLRKAQPLAEALEKKEEDEEKEEKKPE